MASRRDVAIQAGAIALTAAGLYAGTGLSPSWWLTWVAPVPVLAVARRSGRAAAFASGFLAWLLGSLNMWGYLRGDVGLPLGIVVAFTIPPAALFGLAALLFRALARRQRIAAAALAVPALWTTAEYLMSTASPHGTFWSVAYTQADFLPVVQLASVFGLWGITFLVMFAGAAAAALLPPAGGTWRFAVVSAAAVGVALGYGVWRLQSSPATVETATIGLAAADTPGEPRPSDDPAARDVLDAYARSVAALGSRNVDVVVLPETVARVSDSNIGEVEAVFRKVADSRGLDVVIGLARESGGIQQNEALAIRPGGALAASYAKHHLIPGLEARYRPGQQLTILQTANASWGLAVCKDMDFPALGRRYGERGVALMLVPAWDFDRDGWLHSRMAVMRGVESGFAVARSARRGLLTVSDAYGRVVAEANSASAPVTTLAADVPLARIDTVYRRFGDWFAWLNAVVLAWLLAMALGAPRRAERTVPEAA